MWDSNLQLLQEGALQFLRYARLAEFDQPVRKLSRLVSHFPKVYSGHMAGDNVEECESDRDRQPGNIDTARPRRRRAYGRQRRHDKVRRPLAAKNISGGTRAKPQDGGGDTHDEHGVDEQQPAAAMDRPALLR